MTTTLDPRPRSDGETAPPSVGAPKRSACLTRLPVLILYPCSTCNCRCQMCDIWQVAARDLLDPAWVASEAPQWRAMGVQRVVLSGGEPLMHPRLAELARPLTEAGIGITLLTTGLLLRRYAPVVAAFADDIIVSLDGPPAVHDRIRNVPKAFARLADGVAALRDVAPAVAVSARCTVQRANYRHLPETVTTAVDLGLDGISFLAVDVASEAFNRPGGWAEGRRAEVALGSEDLPRLRATLERMATVHAASFASGFIAETPAKLARLLLDHFTALSGEGEWPPAQCNAPWVSAVVEADGTLRPCFFHQPIGRWTGGSLAEVVNGSQAVEFRANLDVASNPVCVQCVCRLNLVEAGAGQEGGGAVL